MEGTLDVPLDSVVDAAWAALDSECKAAAGSSGDVGCDFFVRMRGIGWTAGGGYDVIATEANKGAPRTWCRTYNMQLSSSFSAAKSNGVGSGVVLDLAALFSYLEIAA